MTGTAVRGAGLVAYDGVAAKKYISRLTEDEGPVESILTSALGCMISIVSGHI